MKRVSALPGSLQHYAQQARYGKPSVFTERLDKGVVYGCVHTHTHTHMRVKEYYAALRKDIRWLEITQIDTEGIVLSETGPPLYNITYMWTLYDVMEV